MENRPSREMLIETGQDKTGSREGQDGNILTWGLQVYKEVITAGSGASFGGVCDLRFFQSTPLKKGCLLREA